MSLEKIDLSTLSSGQFCWTQEYCPYKFNLPCENLVGVYVADEISVTESISFTTSGGEHRVQNWSDRRGSACTDGFGTLAQTTSENAPFFKPASQGGKGIRFDGKSWLTGQLKNIINDSKAQKDQFTLVFSGVESPDAGSDASTRPLFSFRADGGVDLEVTSQPFGVETSTKAKAQTKEFLNFSAHAANSTATTYAVVINNFSASFYKDGQLISNAAQGGLPSQAGILDLGCRLALNTNTKTGNTVEAHEDTRAMGDCFKGTLLGFAAYKAALDVDAIQRIGRVLANEEELVIRPSCSELPAPLHGSIELVPNRQGEVNKEGSSVIFRCEAHGNNDGEKPAASYMWQSAFAQFSTCDKFGRWTGYQSGVVPACVEKEQLDVLEGRKVYTDDDLLSYDALQALADALKEGSFGSNLTGSGVINLVFPPDLEGRFWFEVEYYDSEGKFHPHGFVILADGSIRWLTADEAALFAKQRELMEKAANEQKHNNQNNDGEVTQNPDGSYTVVQKNPDGSTTTTTYHKDGSITSETIYADGSKSTSQTVVNPDGSTTTTIIGADGKLTTIHTTAEENGKTTTTITDENGVTVIVVEKKEDGSVVTTTTRPDKSVVIETVYSNGTKEVVEKKTDGSTWTTVTKPDGSKEVTVVAPDGSKSTTTTDADGTVTTVVVDSDGTKTTTTTKPDGTIIEEVVKPDGSKTTSTWKPDGSYTNVTTEPDGTTVTTEVRPDGSGTITTENPDGSKTVTEVTPDGETTTTTTDSNGNVTGVETGTSDPITVPQKPDTNKGFTYESKDANGNRVVVTVYPDGTTKHVTYTANGDVLEVTIGPDGTKTEVTTKADGTVVTVVTHPNGVVNKTTKLADGTLIEETWALDKTHTTVTTKTDGTVETEIWRPDGTIQITTKKPDGTVIIQEISANGDRTTTTINPDGSKTVVTDKVPAPVQTTTTTTRGANAPLCPNLAHLSADCTTGSTTGTTTKPGSTGGSGGVCVGECCGNPGLRPDCSTGIEEIDDYPRDNESGLPIGCDGDPIVPVLPEVPFPEVVTDPKSIMIEIPVLVNRQYFSIPAATDKLNKVLRALSVFSGTPLVDVRPGDIVYELGGTPYANGLYVDRTGSPYYLTIEQKGQMDSLEEALAALGSLQLSEDAKSTAKSIFSEVTTRLQTLNLPTKLAGYLPSQVVYKVGETRYEPYGAIVASNGDVITLTRREWQQFRNLQVLLNAATQTIAGFIDPATGRLPIDSNTGNPVYPPVDPETIVDYITGQTGASTTTTTKATGTIYVPGADACLGNGRGYGLDCDDASALVGFASNGMGGLIPVTANMFATGLYTLIDLPDLASNGCAAVKKLDALGAVEDRKSVCNGKHTFRTAANEGLFRAALNIENVAMLGLPSANYFSTVVTTGCPASCKTSKFEDKTKQELTQAEREEQAKREEELENQAAPWGTDENGQVFGPDGNPLLVDGKPINKEEMKQLIQQQEENRLAQLEGAQDLIRNYLENIGSGTVKLQEYYSFNGTHYQRSKALDVNITPLMPKIYSVSRVIATLKSGQLGQSYQVALKKTVVPSASVLAILNFNVDLANFGEYGYVPVDPAILSGDNKIVSLISGVEIPAEDLEKILVQSPKVKKDANSPTGWSDALTGRHLPLDEIVKYYNEIVEVLNTLTKLDAVEALYKDVIEQELLADEQHIADNSLVGSGDDWSYFLPDDEEESEEPFVPLPNEQCSVEPHNYIGPGYLTRMNSHGLDKYSATPQAYSAVLVCDTAKEYYPVSVASESLSCSNSTWARPQTLRCAKACRKWSNAETVRNGGLVASPVPQSSLPGTSAQVRCGVGYVAAGAIEKLRAGEQPAASAYEDVATCLTDRKWTTKQLKCYGVGRLSIASGRGAVLHSAPDALLTPSKTGARASDPQTLTVTFSNEVLSSRFYKFIKSGLSAESYAALHSTPPGYPVNFYSSGQKVDIQVPEPVSFNKNKYLSAANSTVTAQANTTLLGSVVSGISNLFGVSFLQQAAVVTGDLALKTTAEVVEDASATQVLAASAATNANALSVARMNNGTYLDFLQPREFNVTQFSREARSFDHVSNVFDVGCSVSIASALALSDKTAHTADMHQSPFASLSDCFRGYVSQIAIWRKQLSTADIARWNEVSRRFMTLAHSKDISQEFVLAQVAEANLTSSLAGLFIANDAFMDFDTAQLRVSAASGTSGSGSASTRAVSVWRNVIPRPVFNANDTSVTAELREAFENHIESLVQTRVQSQPVYADGVGIFFDGKDDYLVSSNGFRPYSHMDGMTINIQATTTRAFGLPQVLVSFPSPNVAAAALAATKKEYQCTSLGPDLMIGIDLAERESETLSICSWRQKGYLTTASTLKPSIAEMVIATAKEEERLREQAAQLASNSAAPVSSFLQLAKASKKAKTAKSNNLSSKTVKPAEVATAAAKSANVVTPSTKKSKKDKTAATATAMIEEPRIEAPVEGFMPEVTGEEMPTTLGVPVDPSLALEDRPGYQAARAYLNSLSVKARTQYKAEIAQVEEIYRSLPPGVDADLEDLVAYMRFEGMDKAPAELSPAEIAEQAKMQAKIDERMKSDQAAVNARLAEREAARAHAAEVVAAQKAAMEEAATSFVEGAQSTSFVESGYGALIRAHETFRLKQNGAKSMLGKLFNPASRVSQDRAAAVGVNLNAARQAKKAPSTEASE